MHFQKKKKENEVLKDYDYVESTVSISNYPLSAALTCTKICPAFEEKWGIV